jgi:glutathione S-transferase
LITPILHHYPASPYAEKIRLMLGFKKLTWQSVRIPEIMPKPDVVALTGGYRRTPILQLGADVYCDTRLIQRALERLAPSPTLFPHGDSLSVLALSHFGDQVLFDVTVPIAFGDEQGFRVFFPEATPESIKRFREDRAAMRKNSLHRRGSPGECRAVYAFITPRVEAQLVHGGPFLFGSAPCVADFSIYHPYWAISKVPQRAGLLQAYPRLAAWLDRMKEIGHGSATDITSGQALEIARTSRAAMPSKPRALEPEGFELGQTVEVLPVDYALDAVRGQLVECSAEEISVRREDPRAGTVTVHFPRMGFQLRRPQD